MEDFYWLLDQFWNKTHHQFVLASQRANMSSAPSVILWSSEYLHHHQQVTLTPRGFLGKQTTSDFSGPGRGCGPGVDRQ